MSVMRIFKSTKSNKQDITITNPFEIYVMHSAVAAVIAGMNITKQTYSIPFQWINVGDRDTACLQRVESVGGRATDRPQPIKEVGRKATDCPPPVKKVGGSATDCLQLKKNVGGISTDHLLFEGECMSEYYESPLIRVRVHVGDLRLTSYSSESVCRRPTAHLLFEGEYMRNICGSPVIQRRVYADGLRLTSHKGRIRTDDFAEEGSVRVRHKGTF
jgi:hypothetical protein